MKNNALMPHLEEILSGQMNTLVSPPPVMLYQTSLKKPMARQLTKLKPDPEGGRQNVRIAGPEWAK
jgi:hypothetical protein